MPKLKEIQEKREKLFAEMRQMVEVADKEDRDFTSDEEERYQQLEADYDANEEQREHAVRQRDRRGRVEEIAEAIEQERRVRPSRDIDPHGAGQAETGSEVLDWRGLHSRLASTNLLPSERRDLVARYRQSEQGRAHSELFKRWMSSGGRLVDPGLVDRAALQMDVDTSGGVLVPPVEFIARLIDGLDDQVFIRQLATVLPMTSAVEVRLPSLDNDPADADWTVELSAGSEDSTMDFGQRSLFPKPLRKYIKVSKDLLRQGVLDVGGIVADRLRFKFGITEEKAFLTGSGAGQPLGVFTASDDGISTGQDVSEDNSTTAPTADGFINAKYALKAQYHMAPGLRWVMHRDTLKIIRKLKTGDGEYIWNRGLSSDKGDMILDVPFVLSEHAPNTFTTGQYVAILGDFSQYYIADVTMMEMEEARELYLETWQHGFFASRKLDGMPVLEEAFVRVTLA